MVYHVFNKSIAGFVIFNNESEFNRMLKLFQYYKYEKSYYSFSKFTELQKSKIENRKIELPLLKEGGKSVAIISYCVMPTHFHLILKEIKENCVPTFMSKMLNSYARYFNIRHNRKGHLWEGTYKKVLITSDEQLLHLTRYIHLNPVTAYLVNKPEEWPYSSYKEYLKIGIKPSEIICDHTDLFNITPSAYKEFVESRISYQRELAKIKELLLE
ncbi:MAG: transposase [Candidatus Omnitrophota bacterium]